MLKVPLTTVTFLSGKKTRARAGSLQGKLLLCSYCSKHGCVSPHRLALLCIISMRLLGVWGFLIQHFVLLLIIPQFAHKSPRIGSNGLHATLESTRIKPEDASNSRRWSSVQGWPTVVYGGGSAEIHFSLFLEPKQRKDSQALP